MTVVSVVATTVLGVSFVIAGASKLAARSLWRSQARDFGAPTWVVEVLPWLELVVGAAVLVRLSLPVSGTVALGVLTVFTVAIVWRIAQGRRPACACFGSWSSSPIGWRHLVRNLVLTACAVVAIVWP